jgi:hypothetical protein
MELLQIIWKRHPRPDELFVIPDWGSLIALLPVFMAIVVVVVLRLAGHQYRRSGPKRRRPAGSPRAARRRPHAGPTYAPFFAAFGPFLCSSARLPGPLLFLGTRRLILSLLYWGREALATTTTSPTSHPQLPAVVHTGPAARRPHAGPVVPPILASIGVASSSSGSCSRLDPRGRHAFTIARCSAG